jgi:Tfp pilus assembly protein FimT
MKKPAFTYLELVIVIVLIGILAVMSLNRLSRDHLYEAADQIISHIRYTQHLSMVDDRYDPTTQNWQNAQYRIQFHNAANNNGYSIYRDLDADNDLSAGDDIVRDPQTNRLICGNDAICANNRFEQVDISRQYGVTVTVANSNGARQILFDYLGRPLFNNATYPNPANNDIQITLTARDGENLTINIATETGFVSII